MEEKTEAKLNVEEMQAELEMAREMVSNFQALVASVEYNAATRMSRNHLLSNILLALKIFLYGIVSVTVALYAVFATVK